MNRELMRKYYLSTYSEPETIAVKNNEKYRQLRRTFEEHEKEFEKALNNHKLFMMYEELLADYIEMQSELCIEMYLLGAEDREKMLQ